MKRYLASLVAVLVFTAASAYAGVELQPGVARVSLIHGDVTTQRGDSGDWVNASLNTPLTAGDKVATGPDSRAEIQLDYANVLRLADNANASIADLTRDRIQVQLGLGLADFSQLRDSNANIEIDTPNIAVRPLRPGVYRIQVNSAAETEVIVRQGEAEVTTPQGSTRVQSGQQITIEGTNNPEYQTVSAPQKDDWDRWNSDRDSLISRATSWRYTNQYYTGSQDLDDYGHWVNVPDYGPVWSPAVGPGWAPYSYGNWVWEPYYGWTWVSNEPWGWAPYHYGRWFLYGSSWCWWPGPVYGGYYPVWAPAYVSFFGFGFGGGFGFGFGFGNIGWLPIGPGDYYHPWYGRGVNVVNVTNITNIYNYGRGGYGHGGYRGISPLYRGRNGYSNLRNVANNPRLLGSVSSLRGHDFGRVPVRHAGGIDANTFRHGGMLTGRVPVVPSRASLGTPARPANNRIASNQHFFSRGRGAAVRPVSFNRQVTQMQNVMRNSAPSVTAQANRLGLSRQQPGGRTNASAADNQGRGAQRFGNSNNPRTAQTIGRNGGTATQPGRQGQANAARNGWNSFGGNSNRANGAQSFGRNNSPAQSGRQSQGNDARNWRPLNGSTQNNSPRMQNGGNRNFGPSQGSMDRGGARASQGSQPQPRSGWRSFSNSGDRGPSSGGGNQGWRPAQSTGSYGQGQRGGNQNGWRPFSQDSGQGQARGQSNQGFRSNGGQQQPNRGASRQGWQRFSDSGRPALNLQQPIVTRRPSDNYGRGNQGAYRNNSGGGYYGGGRQAAPTREYGGGSSWGRGAYGGNSGYGSYGDRGNSVGNRGGYSGGGGGRSAGSWGGGGSRGGYSGGGGGGRGGYSGGGGGGRSSGGGGGSHASGGSSHGNSHR